MPDNQTEKLADVIEDLDKSVEELDENVEKLNDKYTFWPVFARGVVGALGAAIGATIILALLIFILQKLAGTPYIGEYFYAVLETIQQNK